ncbi:MAG: CNNM domain-containing protein [Endomicrobiia bacterium]
MIVYILFLMILSFFFSGSESALTSLPDYKIRKLYIKHKILKQPLNIWVVKPYRILIAIIIGNTAVNLLLSYFSTKMFLDLKFNLSRETKEIIIWLTTTFVVMIFCELIPKFIGKNFSEKFSQISLFILYILQYFVFIVFSPILYFVEKYLNKQQYYYFTKIDELRKAISEASKQILQKDINEFLERAVKFEDVIIKDIFVPKDKVVMIDISKKDFQQIITELIEANKTRIPLYNGSYEKIIGYVLIKDLFYLCSTSECVITDIVHPILEVNLKDKAKDVLKKFKETQILIAKVVDDNKKFCGIVTLEDIIEELVGEILDEYDFRFANR